MQPLPSLSRSRVSPVYTGEEWIIDAKGCDPELLACMPVMKRLMEDVVHDLGLNVVGHPLTHQFPSPDGLVQGGMTQGGVTLLYLLSESHLAAHTYPEHAMATLNLYCCCHREPWDWQSELRLRLGASEVSVKRIPRGDVSGQDAEGRR